MWKHILAVIGLQILAVSVLLIVTDRALTQRESVEFDRVQNEDFHAHQVYPGVWVGSYPSSLQYNHLKKNKITHVVSLVKGLRMPPAASQNQELEYLVFKAEDTPSQNLLMYFDLVHDFIEDALQRNESVLVHCHAGISRSATMAISYIMKSLGSDRETAHVLARKARSIISPNRGFIEQLEHFEKQVLNPNDSSQHFSHPDILSKIEKAFPIHADVVKVCKRQSCDYIVGNFVSELIDDMLVIVRYLMEKMSNLGPVRNLNELHTFEAGSEVITEIFGSAVGGTVQHSVAKIRIKKGGKSRDHYHPVAEESYLILEGKGKIVLNGEEKSIVPGDNVGIVAKTRHQIFNAGEEDLVFYAICSPPWTPDCSVFLD